MKFISTKTSIDATWRGHFGPITCVEWSPDGTHIATGSYDGNALIWRASDLSVIHTFSHTRLVNGVRWSKDGRFLAVACGDGHCHVWNTHTGRMNNVLSRHTDDVNTLAWSPNGHVLATVSEDGTGRLWNLETNQLIADRLIAHSNHCMSVDFHPSGDFLATCGEDAVIRLWSVAGDLLSDWKQPGDLEMVRWSPNGQFLACACDDKTVRVLDREGTLIIALGPDTNAVKSVSWSPDSKFIVSGSYDLAVRLWSLDGSLLSTVEHGTLWPRGLHWSPTGQHVVVGTQAEAPAVLEVQGWDDRRPAALHMGTPPPMRTCGVNSISASKNLVVAGIDDGTIRVWRPDAASHILLHPLHSRGQSLVNAVDADIVGEYVFYGSFAGDVGVLSLQDGCSLLNIGAPVNGVKWNSAGRLAVVDYRGRLTILTFDGEKLELAEQWQPHDGAVKSACWLDADHIVTGATDRTLRIIDTRGRVQQELAGHGNLINSVDVTTTERGQLIASASRDRTVRIWDAASGRCMQVLVGHTESVKAVSWKPDSRTELASGSYDFDVRVWKIGPPDGSLPHSRILSFHEQGVGSLAWSTNGLFSGSWDGSIARWTPDDDNQGPTHVLVVPTQD